MGKLDPEMQMDHLNALDRTGLRASWERIIGVEPPPHLSVQFMRKVLIHDFQLKRSRGYSKNAKQVLKNARNSKTQIAVSKPKMRQGAQLVREWNGRRYQVAVTDDGFELDGKRFKSLSAVAYHITGARWSGPRFFGITDRKGKG